MKSQITAILLLSSYPSYHASMMTSVIAVAKTPEEMKSVSFKGVIFSAISVKSSKTIPAGIRAVILAYESGDNPVIKSCYPATPLTVISDQNGNLVIENESPLFMPVGNYDFYAISINSGNQEKFEFDAGKIKGLMNGTELFMGYKKRDSHKQ